jgi:hypothetical protein
MLIADTGRANGLGEERPLGFDKFGDFSTEEGCCRTENTNVLFAVRRAH